MSRQRLLCCMYDPASCENLDFLITIFSFNAHQRSPSVILFRSAQAGSMLPTGMASCFVLRLNGNDGHVGRIPRLLSLVQVLQRLTTSGRQRELRADVGSRAHVQVQQLPPLKLFVHGVSDKVIFLDCHHSPDHVPHFCFQVRWLFKRQ